MHKNLNKTLEKLKVNIACKELGIFEEHYNLYTVIHYLFEQGFDTEQSLEASVEDFDALERVSEASIEAAIWAGCTFQELDYIQRLHVEPFHRIIHFEKYTDKIRPLIQQTKLPQILKYIYNQNIKFSE